MVNPSVGEPTHRVFFNHVWPFAREVHRTYVSSTFLQPVIAYATKTETTFTFNTESSYDWHNDQWTVPINIKRNEDQQVSPRIIVAI